MTTTQKSPLDARRDQLAKEYGANSRHLKTEQHFIDGWNSALTELAKAPKDAREILFDGHGCLTGDCPHEKQRECFEFVIAEAFTEAQAEITDLRYAVSVALQLAKDSMTGAYAKEEIEKALEGK